MLYVLKPVIEAAPAKEMVLQVVPLSVVLNISCVADVYPETYTSVPDTAMLYKDAVVGRFKPDQLTPPFVV